MRHVSAKMRRCMQREVARAATAGIFGDYVLKLYNEGRWLKYAMLPWLAQSLAMVEGSLRGMAEESRLSYLNSSFRHEERFYRDGLRQYSRRLGQVEDLLTVFFGIKITDAPLIVPEDEIRARYEEWNSAIASAQVHNRNVQAKKKKQKAVPDRKAAYREYLKTPHWQKKRKEVLARDERKCQTCGTGKNLHVHHNSYKNLGNEGLDDLITLCGLCHETFHKNRRVV